MSFERIIPGTIEWDAYYANHIFRYQFALEKLQSTNKSKVLDAACGVGYGADYLSRNGIKSLVAIDRNENALAIATAKFSRENILYLKDDCLTFEHATQYGKFDAVVSFETLEHLSKPAAFIKNCYSVLEPKGLFIISTPNASVTSPGGQTKWEYHEKEYIPEELKLILKDNGFDRIELYGQCYSQIGSLRKSMRAELNRINSNPFARAGRLLQKMKGIRFSAVLPEEVEDFKIMPYESFKDNQPFVLIALAYKNV